jgi:hypothetical protein
MEKVVGHLLYIELHANNKFVVYSPTLSAQIPTSFAAYAFHVFQNGVYQYEIVRLCARYGTKPKPRKSTPHLQCEPCHHFEADMIPAQLSGCAALPTGLTPIAGDGAVRHRGRPDWDCKSRYRACRAGRRRVNRSGSVVRPRW